MFFLVLACSQGTDAPDIGESPLPEPAHKAEPAFFTWALELPLRAGAAADAPIEGKVTLNNPLQVLRQEGDWSLVVGPQGQRGFLPSAHIGRHALDLIDFDKELAQATDPEQRLIIATIWTARQSYEREAWVALSESQRATGHPEEADKAAQHADSFEVWFDGYAEPAKALTTALKAPTSAASLLEMWGKAYTLADRMSPYLAVPWGEERNPHGGKDPKGVLRAAVPWLALTTSSLTSALLFSLDNDFWKAAAHKTPETVDDAWFGLLFDSCGTVDPELVREEPFPNPRWTGSHYEDICSKFGEGEQLHLAFLLRAEAFLSEPLVATEAEWLRDEILSDVLSTHRPYCREDDPARVEKREAEGQAILARVKLSEKERMDLKARITARFER